MSTVRLEFNDGLVNNLVRQGLINGLKVASEMVKAEAKGKCPVDTGRLRADINNQVDATILEAKIGTNVEYAPYVEFGVAHPVTITPKTAKVLSWVGKDGKRVFAKYVTIPARPPRPFLYPALMDNQSLAFSLIGQEVKKVLGE